jgi:hypothetical protein
MIKGKSYLFQVPDGREVKGKFLGKEDKLYLIEFEKSYSKKIKKISINRFESGIACFEGTDHLILKQL